MKVRPEIWRDEDGKAILMLVNGKLYFRKQESLAKHLPELDKREEGQIRLIK